MTKQLKGRAIIANAIKNIENPVNWVRNTWGRKANGDSAEMDMQAATCMCVGGAIVKGAGIRRLYDVFEDKTYRGKERLGDVTHLSRVFQHLIEAAYDASPKLLGFQTFYTDFNDNYNVTHADALALLRETQKRVAADPFFRRSSARIAGTEKHVQRAQRAVRRANAKLAAPAQASA